MTKHRIISLHSIEIQLYKHKSTSILSFNLSSHNFFLFRNRLTAIAPFALSVDITSRLFAVSHDAKYIFSGAHWDRSLHIYAISKTHSNHSITRRTDIITCLTLDA